MINEKKYLILLILFAAIVLISPSLIRLMNNNSQMINSEAYYNLRIYNQASANYDSLQSRAIPLNIINMIRLNDFARQILFKIVPVILGLLTVWLSYMVLHKQNISEKTIIAIIALVITSPIFIYIFTEYKIYSFVIFLTILGVYFLIQDKVLISSVIFSIIPFIDLFSGIVTVIMLIVYYISDAKNRMSIKLVTMILFAAIVLSSIINSYLGYNLMHMVRFSITNILVDIGANIGISFSIIILTVIGMILLWENGWRNLVTYILLILIAILSLFNNTIRIYFGLVIMIYAGFAFIYLNKRKWSIAIIKKTTILLIICSVFFSTLVYTTQLVRSEPSSEYVDALLFLKNQSLETEVLLSSPTDAYFIGYYTNRTVYIDDLTKYYDLKKYSNLDLIATSRNLERTEKLFNDYNIKYIVIGKEFEPYLKEKEGLLFLIESSGKFIQIYKNSAVEIWMYNS